MRVTSLIVTLALLVGSARSAQACPAAELAKSCCCDPPERDRPDARVDASCCCASETERRTLAPTVWAPGSRETASAVPIVVAAAPAPAPRLLPRGHRLDRHTSVPPPTLVRLLR